MNNYHLNRRNLFALIITLLTFILVIIAIIIMNRNKLRKNHMRSRTELESEEK